eukprot:scpid11312/ scgid8994/ Ras-associated and pleckstrin homology domains-containing protein 1; Amyotrophic lateral sclerosis 2 chromosomal region candidate gene 18 protein; Amyotrophic lateral sclerosis 2 chromosomal region candidate gene 9 protein; Lamellipodin; Proline-rich EVH1 ligand 2; Protein RMO1
MASLDDGTDPEQDRADLVTWLQAYDLQGLHSTLVDFGYDKLTLCTLLDETTLEEMGIKSRAHLETLLTAVNDLKQLDADVDEYDDGWSSQEESDEKTEPVNDAVNGEDTGAMVSTMRFLSGLDSGKLEESYRESFVDDSVPDADLSLPPPPPPISAPADHQYAEIPVPPPPPQVVTAHASGDDLEEKTTSSFLASLGSSMGSFLGGDTFDDMDGPPIAPKPKPAPRSPKASNRDLSEPPPVPSTARPTPPPERPPVERQMSGPKPAAAPRKPKPPPPSRDESSLAPSDSPDKPAASPKSALKAPTTSTAPFDLYASVNKPTGEAPGKDLPPVKSAGPPPAAKSKPVTKPKGVSIVEPEKSVKRSPSDSKLKDPKDRRSMVDIQGGDVDLDALLADLLEMENAGAGSSSSGSPVKSSTAPVSRPVIQKPAPAPLDEDEFSRLMAEMDMMSNSSSLQPQSDPAAGRVSSDLSREITKLSGGGKVIQPVSAEDMSTSVITASLLGSDNQFETAPSPSVEDDLEALSRDLGASTSSRLSGSFVSSIFGSDSSTRRTSDEAVSPPSDDRRPSGDVFKQSKEPVMRQPSDFRRPSESPSVTPGFDVEVREVRNTAIVKLPEKPQERLERELAQLNNGNTENLSEADKDARLKALKVQMAVEKLKEAKVKKVVLKAYNDDGSSKMIVIDDKMTAREVCSRLMKKNRVQPGPNYVLIEQLTEHYIERRLEDHDLVVPVLDSWPRESNNSIAFTNKPDKYMLLKRPQLFMPSSHAYAPGKKTAVKESTKRDIIMKELFVAQTLPDIEGYLMYKEGRKGNWKKQYFSLRKSGLYYSHKGKAAAMKDLHRLAELKDMDVYTGHAYRKKYKANTEFCFSLKPAGPLDITERKMRHFCAETRQEQNSWIQGIRLAKLGNSLLEDYELTYKQMPWLSRETEEEIDGIIRLQEESTEDDKRDRTGTLGRLRRGTQKKQGEHAAQDLAARSEMATSSGSPIASRPVSTVSVDDPDGPERTTWQKQFGQAWKSAAEDDNGGMRISLDDLPPTPKTTATPYTSEFAPGDEDGMYNLRLY